MSVLSSAQVTLAWSAGILATVRYYQLAAPFRSDASCANVLLKPRLVDRDGIPTADVTKVLWTCERTVYADGTESWSNASKSTSYEAAKDAKGTANAAKDVADGAQRAAGSARRTLHRMQLRRPRRRSMRLTRRKQAA